MWFRHDDINGWYVRGQNEGNRIVYINRNSPSGVVYVITGQKGKFQLLPHAPPYYPFPRGKSILGVIYGVYVYVITGQKGNRAFNHTSYCYAIRPRL